MKAHIRIKETPGYWDRTTDLDFNYLVPINYLIESILACLFIAYV